MQPVEIIAAFFNAGAACDLDTLTRLFAENARWDNRIDDDPMGGLYEGRATIRRNLLEPLFEFLPEGISTSIERVIETGDTVVCLNCGSGITSDGQQFEKRYAHIFDIADGLIIQVTEYRA
jgi:ketosteroid isomerase-like protein